MVKDMNDLYISFSSYAIQYGDPPTQRKHGDPPGPPTSAEARIDCLQGDFWRGWLLFWSREVPPNGVNQDNSGHHQITLNYPINRFNDIYSIIRHEKNLYLWLDPNTLNGSLRTGVVPAPHDLSQYPGSLP